MQRIVLVLALAVLGGALLSSAVIPAQGQDDPIRAVVVTNFPDPQKVAGSISIEGHVRHATFQRIREVIVPPVDPKETGRLIDGGVLTTDGFTAALLSLNAQARGRILRAGAVGAILIPEEESVTRAFEEEGFAEFPLEVSTSISSGEARSFASAATRLTVAFPRYRVHLYNTSDKTVTVSLFAYLTN